MTGSIPVTRQLVQASRCDDVTILRLADPARRNVLSCGLSRDLARAVHDALADGAGALVLTAAPPVFSAGGSFDELARDPVPLKELYEGFLALARAPVPTLAVVDGPAVGAGVNLALACDVIIATPRAVFDPRFIDAGVHPGGGHLWRLERRVGRQAAAALVLFGERLSGEEAVARGLAWRCVPSAEAETTALALARRAAARDRELVLRTKVSLTASGALADADAAMDLEHQAQEWAFARPEFPAHIEALRQLVTRKRP